MINPFVQVRRIGLALEERMQRQPELLPRIAAILVVLIALVFGTLLATGAPLLYLLVPPLGLIGLWATFTYPEYAALFLLGFRWGFIFDSLDSSIGLQSPSLPLAALLLIVLAYRVSEMQQPQLKVDPILILLLLYFMHVSLGVWYAVNQDLVVDRMVEFAKDILYTLVVAYWLVKPQYFGGAVWLLIAVGGLFGSLTIYQELTQTFDNSYWDLAKVKIAFIVEGLEDRPRAGGPLGDPNFYAQQILVIFPLALWGAMHARLPYARIFAIFSALVIFIAIGRTFSRGALVALLVMVAVYFVCFKVRLRYVLYLIPLVVLAILFAPPELIERFATLTELTNSSDATAIEDNSLQNRFLYLIVGSNMFLDSPIWGIGADHFKALYIEYVLEIGVSPDLERDRNAHNFYLEVLTEHGLIGLGLLLAMMGLALRRLLEGQRQYEAIGDRRMADLSRFLQVGYAGYAFSAIFLHGDFPRFIWLFLGIAIAFAESASEAEAEHQTVLSRTNNLGTPSVAPAVEG